MANNLTRFDPFRDTMRLSPLRTIEEFMRDFPIAGGMRGFDAERQIRIDVQETDQAYLVKADMPGFKKEDIKIAVDGTMVSISATTQGQDEQTVGDTVYSERYSGSQYRSFTLLQEVDDSKTEAKYQDGVLHLTLPKKPGTARKQIAVQ
ncbi:Hsp20/alpha crystallin family protein [Massilia sp. G4R7]|uniref:Hsp20/alpha crystallin family protein n=1 Tax=Massilia phyllostachyos TaxID=2898585 RepID=A0ABS8Q365_9BURK|nr:Hsp20/alpha crystallin family protein [Massilia phyllostachyos]MCD2516184.1 Hsp20/alpha crystallin family protein [Massilia phyllostachyos]